MDKDYPYDCLIVFPRPLRLEGQIVYGMIFSKQKEIDKYENRYREKCGTKYLDTIENYIRYLYCCNDYYNSENKIRSGIWRTIWGHSIIEDWVLTDSFFNSKKVKYSLIEKEEPIPFNENETDGDWVLSLELIERVKK